MRGTEVEGYDLIESSDFLKTNTITSLAKVIYLQFVGFWLTCKILKKCGEIFISNHFLGAKQVSKTEKKDKHK